MNNQIEPTDIVYEVEGSPDEPQTDEVWVRDGKGRPIQLEVADDA